MAGNDSIKDQITAAFSRLPLKPGAEQRSVLVIQMLASIGVAGSGSGRPSAMFRQANRSTSEKELERLARQAGRLARLARDAPSSASSKRVAGRLVGTVGDLHHPTILALADVGLFGASRIALGGIAQQLANGEGASEDDIGALSFAALCARHADPSDVAKASNRARPANNLAKTVVRILYRTYQDLTGKRPSRTVQSDHLNSPESGLFLHLVRDVFSALQIDAKPEAYVRAELDARRPRPVAEGLSKEI